MISYPLFTRDIFNLKIFIDSIFFRFLLFTAFSEFLVWLVEFSASEVTILWQRIAENRPYFPNITLQYHLQRSTIYWSSILSSIMFWLTTSTLFKKYSLYYTSIYLLVNKSWYLLQQVMVKGYGIEKFSIMYMTTLKCSINTTENFFSIL